MSQSQMAAPVAQSDLASRDVCVIDSEKDVQDVLDALNDADCRSILDVTSNEAFSAKEISESCDLPLSTTYRKLDMLTDAGLLEERTRLRVSGEHASEYSRLLEDMFLSVGPEGGIRLEVATRGTAEGRLPVGGVTGQES